MLPSVWSPCWRAQVRFEFSQETMLGDVWKLCGSACELGNWVPEIAPCMYWQGSGVWSADLTLPPGEYCFKAMRRNAYGSYTWEAGDDRILVGPPGSAEHARGVRTCRLTLWAVSLTNSHPATDSMVW